MIEHQREINLLITKYIGRKNFLFPLLYEIQKINGYLNEEILELVSQRVNISLSELLSLTSFYSMFQIDKPFKKTVKIYNGVDCHLNGSPYIIRLFKSILKNSEYKIEICDYCNCTTEGLTIKVNNKKYNHISAYDLEDIIKEILGGKS